MEWGVVGVIIALIENTVMKKCFRDGVHQLYTITPVDGYVLHDNFSDWTITDPETGRKS